MIKIHPHQSTKSRKKKAAATPTLDESPLWLDDYLPYRAAVAAGEIGKLISPYYQQLGLSMAELAVISVLYEIPALTQQMIVGRTVMEKFTISRAVKSLLRRDLISRCSHETDGRSHWLSLTPAGRRLYEQMHPITLAFEEKLKDALGGEAQLKAMKKTLQELQDATKRISLRWKPVLTPDTTKVTQRARARPSR